MHAGRRNGDKRKGFTEAGYARLPGAARQQLTALVKTRLRLMQYRPGLLAAFLARTGLGESAPVDP